MSVLLFHRDEPLLQLGIRPAAIALPLAMLLKIEASKPAYEHELRGLFAKLSAHQKDQPRSLNAHFIIELSSPKEFYFQALVPPSGEHIVLEAASEKFVKNWKQVVPPERRAILLALGYEEPGPRSPNYRLEIPHSDAASIELAARIAAITLSMVFGINTIKDAKIELSMPADRTSLKPRSKREISRTMPVSSVAAPMIPEPLPKHPAHPGIADAPQESYGNAITFNGAVAMRSQNSGSIKPEEALLLRQVDETDTRDIRLNLRADGSIEVNTCDAGDAPLKTFGHEDYEWWITISPENISKLAFALLIEKFQGHFDATDEVKEFCKQAGVEFEWSSYP